MGKIIYLFAVACLLISCSKKSDIGNAIPGAPLSEGKPEYDKQSFGVYKGVLAGPTGLVKIVINNGDAINKAYLNYYNGRLDTLICNTTIEAGKDIQTLRFTGKKTYMDFSVKANGTAAEAKFHIPEFPEFPYNPGTSSIATIAKETSKYIVKCYLGTYHGHGNGVCNVIIWDGKIEGVLNMGNTNFKGAISGTAVNGKIEGKSSNDLARLFGTYTDSSFNASWNFGTGTAYYSGVRKM